MQLVAPGYSFAELSSQQFTPKHGCLEVTQQASGGVGVRSLATAVATWQLRRIQKRQLTEASTLISSTTDSKASALRAQIQELEVLFAMERQNLIDAACCRSLEGGQRHSSPALSCTCLVTYISCCNASRHKHKLSS